MHDRRGFHLSKWYLDAVSPGGEAVIVYVAQLGWGGLALRYASLLELDGSGRARVASSVRDHADPAMADGRLAWSSDTLGVRGTWRAIAPAAEETLLDAEHGRVEWRCLQPASEVELRVGARGGAGERVVRGLGYAERLELTVPPWRMPIDELHWGRFVSTQDERGTHASVVWIDWRGAHARRLAWVDGARAVAREVAEDRVTLADGAALALDRGAVLREGTLGGTVLAALPKLRDALPGRILGVHERKWRSRGVLERAGRPAVEGWAIHEVVRWP